MTELHASIRELKTPRQVVRLPRDERGYPVPWFVEWIDGKPEFRVMDARKLVRAVRESRCWVCGERLGAWRAYTIGPMCAVNRTSAEPPAHRDCSIYSARACPFLTTPGRPRRERGRPEEAVTGAGIALMRNPGVAGVWVTRGTHTKPDANGALLFDIGEPTETLWFAHGRPATRAQVEQSIQTGLPLLRELAEQDGARAVAELERMLARARTFLPEAA